MMFNNNNNNNNNNHNNNNNNNKLQFCFNPILISSEWFPLIDVLELNVSNRIRRRSPSLLLLGELFWECIGFEYLNFSLAPWKNV